ncbi:MAG: GTP-binding protein [Alphaproteobacteria bacterium]|nr:GTP-binding protein [Alphaproteobacteria bacterium]
MSRAPIPVTVVGGYLGAGKTTLVNHVLREARDRRIVVLVNDFGDIAVDSALIAAREGDKLTLANGCVCCSIGGDLFAAFDCAIEREPAADAILIEASGVAEPERIADFARAEPDLALDTIVVLADAAAVERQLADGYVGATVARQIAAADLLLLNKSDLVDVGARDALRARLARLAPRAALLETCAGAAPLELLFGDDPASRFSCTAPAAVDHEAMFERWSRADLAFAGLDALRDALARLPSGVHRLKGFVRLRDEGRLVLVQAVAGRVDLSPAAPAQAAAPGLVAIWPRGSTTASDVERALDVAINSL